MQYTCLHCQFINNPQFPTAWPCLNNSCHFFPTPCSFQKEFSFDEKDEPAKGTKDIDVSLLANLPKGK